VDYVFTGMRGPLSDMSLTAELRRMGQIEDDRGIVEGAGMSSKTSSASGGMAAPTMAALAICVSARVRCGATNSDQRVRGKCNAAIFLTVSVP
jgi:hypothetical protein